MERVEPAVERDPRSAVGTDGRSAASAATQPSQWRAALAGAHEAGAEALGHDADLGIALGSIDWRDADSVAVTAVASLLPAIRRGAGDRIVFGNYWRTRPARRRRDGAHRPTLRRAWQRYRVART